MKSLGSMGEMRPIFLVFALVLPPCVGAQNAPLPSAASMAPSNVAMPVPPGGIPLGPMVVYPALDVAIGHNDNLYSSNVNKASSAQTTISPSIRAEAKIGPHTFDGIFRLDDVRYSSSPADNYTAYGLLG